MYVPVSFCYKKNISQKYKITSKRFLNKIIAFLSIHLIYKMARIGDRNWKPVNICVMGSTAET